MFEAIRVDETIRRLINDGGDEAIIARHAFLHSPNLGSAARQLVREAYDFETNPETQVDIREWAKTVRIEYNLGVSETSETPEPSR